MIPVILYGAIASQRITADETGVLRSVDISNPANITSFTRAWAAGYTGNGETGFQREATQDELRISHYVAGVPCVLLEEIKTECQLVAPTGIAVTPDGLDLDVEFNAIPVTADLDHYEWQLDGVGAAVNIGTDLLFSATRSPGTHTVHIRAVSTGGIAGTVGISDEFDLVGEGVTFSDDFARSDSTALGANWTEEAANQAISSGKLQMIAAGYAKNLVVFSGAATSTADQFCRVQLTIPDSGFGNAYLGVVLRYTDAASPYYLVLFRFGESDVQWLSLPDAPTGAGPSLVIAANSLTFTQGDVFGLTVNGTGDTTRVRIWQNPTATAPDSAALWDGVAPLIEFSVDPESNAVDSGGHIGFECYQPGEGSTMVDNFFGGDIV